METLIHKLKEFLIADDGVKFAYLFGSQARQDIGPLSDVDVAVYLDDTQDFFQRRLTLMEALIKRLGREDLDLVVLNKAPVVLKFEVIKSGIVLKEDRSRRVVFETTVMREYLDTAHLRNIQCEYLKERLRRLSNDG